MSNKHDNLDKVDLFRRRFLDQFIDDGDEEDGIQAAVSSADREMCSKGRTESSSSSIVDGSRRKNTKNERGMSKEAAKLNAASMCPYQRSCAMDIFSCIMIDNQHHQLPNTSRDNVQETTSIDDDAQRSLRYQRSSAVSTLSFIASSSLPPINDEVANNAIEVTQSIHQRIVACFMPHVEEEAKGLGRKPNLLDNKASVKSTSTTTIPSLQKTTTFDTTSSDQSDSLESDGIEVELGSTSPTNERRSLALLIVCTLCASFDDNGIVIPYTLIEKVLCKDVINTVFLNVLCASGGGSRKKTIADGTVNTEHHLKPLTTSFLTELVSRCRERGDVDRQITVVRAFLACDPRFDVKTKTDTVGSILMLSGPRETLDEGALNQRKDLWDKYLCFLEEEIISAESLNSSTSYIELMYKLAKYDLSQAPADVARKIVRFFMSAAFFDCSDMSSSSSSKKKKSKKKSATTESPQELSSGVRISELLKSHKLTSISFASRKLMSARFYSLLSDFILVLNAQGRRKNHTEFYGKVSRPETIYRALSEICGISTLLESSGANKLNCQSTDENVDRMEESRKSMLKVQSIADETLVSECNGKGDAEILRAKSVFTTSCASLMMSLYMQLNSCGNPDTSDEEEEDDDEDIAEAVHEYISDLADSVTSFCALMEDSQSQNDQEDDNPLAAVAGLLVNILSSPVGGEDADRKNAVQASASKLTRETVKLTWQAMNAMQEKHEFVKTLLNEDVMTILIEAVCGEDANGTDSKDDESIEESVSSSGDDADDDDNVFVNANKMEMDLDEVENVNAENSNDEEQSSREDDDSVELDPSQLENMLLEDSDAEMSDSGPHGVLEHHAGADKALAQLIKLKQEARKASQTERERIELRNQLRCATLLESLFSGTVFKNGWMPIEAILGSIGPILRYRKALAKSIQSS
ncbi:hypothetical protein ACHAWC_004844, partial [Mediolabrus comicus]